MKNYISTVFHISHSWPWFACLFLFSDMKPLHKLPIISTVHDHPNIPQRPTSPKNFTLVWRSGKVIFSLHERQEIYSGSIPSSHFRHAKSGLMVLSGDVPTAPRARSTQRSTMSGSCLRSWPGSQFATDAKTITKAGAITTATSKPIFLRLWDEQQVSVCTKHELAFR